MEGLFFIRKYSFIVPVYNVQDFIENCLLSVQAQDYSNYEVIIVDDGSTDNSSKIAKYFSNKDSRFKYIFQKNAGLSAARNNGIFRSTGEYLLFVDSDDFVESNLLSTIEDYIQEHGELDVLEYNATQIENNRKIKYNKFYKNSIRRGHNDFLDSVNNSNYKAMYISEPAWLKVVNRKFIIENKLLFKDGRLHEDQLWTPQVIINAESYAYLDKELYNYVIHSGTINSGAKGKTNFQHCRKNIQELYQIYTSNLKLNKKQRKFFLTYLAHEYMQICSRSTVHIFLKDKLFILKNSRKFAVLLEAIIFFVSPKLSEIYMGFKSKFDLNIIKGRVSTKTQIK